MQPSVTVDAANFGGFTRALAQAVGREHAEILPLVAGRALTTAVKYTKKANVKQAVQGAQRRVSSKYNTYGQGRPGGGNSRPTPYISLNQGNVWWVDRSADGRRTYYKMNDPRRRWSDARWAEFSAEAQSRQADLKAALKEAQKNAKKSRGLSAAGWVAIGKLLGVEVKAPGFVKKAVPSTGQTYPNPIVRRGKQGGVNYLDIGTRMPLLVKKLDGMGILKRSISTVGKAFEGDLRRGIFNDAARTAQRWPGFRIS